MQSMQRGMLVLIAVYANCQNGWTVCSNGLDQMNRRGTREGGLRALRIAQEGDGVRLHSVVLRLSGCQACQSLIQEGTPWPGAEGKRARQLGRPKSSHWALSYLPVIVHSTGCLAARLSGLSRIQSCLEDSSGVFSSPPKPSPPASTRLHLASPPPHHTPRMYHILPLLLPLRQAATRLPSLTFASTSNLDL